MNKTSVLVLLSSLSLVGVVATVPAAFADPGKAKSHGHAAATATTNPYAPAGVGSGTPQGNGNAPCNGCVGNADNKNPPGQAPNGSDHNNGYECDGNHGVGDKGGNPAHSGCTPTTVTPSPSRSASPSPSPSRSRSASPSPSPSRSRSASPSPSHASPPPRRSHSPKPSSTPPPPVCTVGPGCAPPPHGGGALPFTGAPTHQLAVLAGLMMLAGLEFLLLSDLIARVRRYRLLA